MVEPTSGLQQGGGRPDPSTADYARTYRALRTLSAGNRTLARAADEPGLLADMCRAIVDQGGYRMAWIGYADHDQRKTIRPLARAGDEGLMQAFELSWDAGVEQPTARAIRGRKAQMGKLMPHAHAPDQSGAVGTAPGVLSVCAFPLIVEGGVVGGLSIVASEPDAFGEEELNVLSELAEDIAFGIGALRSRAREREAEATIRHMALHDGLTGLPNRALFQKRLEERIAAGRRPLRSFAVVILAVGGFHEVNDILGPRRANELVLQVARKLESLVEAGDLLARVGDDEFALLWADTGAEEAAQKATALLASFDAPLTLSDLAVDVRPRIGISLFPGHGSEADALVRRAAVAAREAKGKTANFAIFSGHLDRDCAQHLSLIAELHRAIARDELRLYCQPQLRIASGELCGAEALVRWAHPERGLVGPDDFIKLAESAGLITPLTYWVLGAVFQQAYAWQAEGRVLPLAVNLSVRDLVDPRLVERIRGLFVTWGVDPANLAFELTESALMEDPAGVLETLNRLKALGVELAIDDFGTGFSGLGYLQRLPADVIKIDQSFVARMIDDPGSDTIVRSTIELAHNLGMRVVAEGVENRAIWERLGVLGCDIAQGYFISEPFPAEAFATWQPPQGLTKLAAR